MSVVISSVKGEMTLYALSFRVYPKYGVENLESLRVKGILQPVNRDETQSQLPGGELPRTA